MSQEKSLMFCSHTCQNLMEHMGINQNLGWDEAYGDLYQLIDLLERN